MGNLSSYYAYSRSYSQSYAKNGSFFFLLLLLLLLLMIAKHQSEFGQNILSVTERSYLALLENAMDYLSMMLILENTGFWYFFCLLSSVINISSSSISCTVTPKPGNYTIFWKNSIKSIFQVYLDILLKLWLILCCHQQKIQKMNHFWHFNDYNSGAVHNSRTKASIFLICSLGFVRRYISFPHFKTFKIKSLGGPFALCPAL